MNQPTRVEEISATLRDEILRGQYRMGERLPSERDLAARFEVNRGAIREALKVLEQLGITAITPGGARIQPIEQASLDILGHLVDLQSIPDPTLIVHLLEVLGALISMSARTALDAASDEQRRDMQSIVEKMLKNPSTDNHDNWKSLGSLFAEINNNLVLRLILNGLKTNFADRLNQQKLMPIDQKQNMEIFSQIAKSLDNKDSTKLANAINDHFELLIKNISKYSEQTPRTIENDKRE